MRYSDYTLCLAVLFILSACSEWPPHEQELKTHFSEHESDYRLLERMLHESKYLSVTEYDGTEAHGVFFERENESKPEVRSERLSNEEDWIVVLQRSGIEGVERDTYSDASVFLRKADFRSDLLADTNWDVGYSNDNSLREILKQCGEIDRDLQCGFCFSELQGDWSITYFWFPGSSESFEAQHSGNLSAAEVMAMATEESSACLRENFDASFK